MIELSRAVARVWRAAVGLRALAEALPDVVAALGAVVPVEGVIVVCIDRGAMTETVVALEPGASAARVVTRARSRAEVEGVLRWLAAGEAVRVPAGAVVPPLDGLVPAPLGYDALVCPLPAPARDAVAVLLGARLVAAELEPAHELAAVPLAVAVAQDALARELVALRQAARAERPVRAYEDRDGLSDRIIGADRGLRSVMERVGMVAHSDVPVLILGETGSGKEIIARAIHDRSPRVAGAFIRVNCGAISPELIDSELFGHERGSFTGATSTHRGWFERAHRGTLFLDEIGELSLAAQVRLLRVLQDGTLHRVGAEASLRVDVRVVAATHRDLSAMVQNGAFREDLWYRLAVFPIDLPPLRAHAEDIPAMAEFFARRAAMRFDLPLRLPTAEDITLLASYAWPGNVRELAAVIDRAVLLGRGVRLEVAAALGSGQRERARERDPDREHDVVPLDDAVRQHIERALRATHGRIEGPGGAASLLGVNPHTLRSRMRKLGVDWTRFRDR